MKKWMVLFSLITLLMGSSVWAEDARKIAVLPFSVADTENMDYLRNGILDMLASRLNVEGKLEVLDKADVQDVLDQIRKKGLTQSDIYALGKKLAADYVVWGSISRNAGITAIDGKLLEIAGSATPVTVAIQSARLDDIIPKMSDFARRIDLHILGEVPATFDVFATAALLPSVKTLPEVQQPKESRTSKTSEPVDVLRSKQGTVTGAASAPKSGLSIPRAPAPPPYTPKVRPTVPTEPTETPSATRPNAAIAPVKTVKVERKAWTSQRLDAKLVGMDAGDVNGDGKTEIVGIDAHNLYIYRKDGEELKLIEKIPGGDTVQYLAVDVANVMGGSVPQIIVSGIAKGAASSFVLGCKDGKFVRLASNLNWLMRAMTLSGKPTLLGQQLGKPETPFNSPIVELVWKEQAFVAGSNMKIPTGIGIYDIALGAWEKEKGAKIAALDSSSTLRVFLPPQKALEKVIDFFKPKNMLWKSAGTFGGTANTFETMRDAKSGSTIWTFVNNVNVRIFFYESLVSGKPGLTLARNIASAGLGFQNRKVFISSEIVDLEWTGKEFVEASKRRKLDGYVAAMQVRDIDRKGQRELLIALVSPVTSEAGEKTTIIALPVDDKKYPSED